MGRSFLYDWGTGIGTNIIGAVLLAIVAIVWKYMKARRNSSMGQPENPVASGQFVIHIIIGGPPTSSPIGGPPTISPIGGPPTSPTPSFGSVASISRTHGQEGIEPCVTDNELSTPPASPTPSFGTLSPKRGGILPPRRGQVRKMVRPKILKYLVESIGQGLIHRRPIDHEE